MSGMDWASLAPNAAQDQAVAATTALADMLLAFYKRLRAGGMSKAEADVLSHALLLELMRSLPRGVQ